MKESNIVSSKDIKRKTKFDKMHKQSHNLEVCLRLKKIMKCIGSLWYCTETLHIFKFFDCTFGKIAFLDERYVLLYNPKK